MSALIAAVRLLTVVPSGRRELGAAALARSPALFPVVGLAIGLASAGMFVLALRAMPAGVAAALAVATGTVLSGAFHLDGLADTADGLFGGRTPERRIEIMSDPRVGTFGVVAVGLALMLKYGTVSALTGEHGWAVIALSAVTGRTAVVLVMAAFRYRGGGMGAPFAPGARRVWPVGVLAGLAACVALGGWWALAPLAAGCAAGLLTGWYASSRLGGAVTGDIYGAAVEVSEVVSLVVFVGLTGGGNVVAPLWT